MIAIKYSLFALISTTGNLLFQYFSLFFYDGTASLFIAMFIGTIAGLISKYILDKKYIFYHIVKGKADDAHKFVIYSFMGVFTTLIFWATEITFDFFSSSENTKYIGAVIGLSIGYTIKYFLDKQYVFRQ
jgi:putative flippase GtrA